MVQTRMHSSRMRTVHCSSRLLGGCLPGGVCLGGGGVCPGGCLPRGWGVSLWVSGRHPPVDRILDRKHYFAATTLRTVIMKEITNIWQYKNAFQQDAYRPLVDRTRLGDGSAHPL